MVKVLPSLYTGSIALIVALVFSSCQNSGNNGDENIRDDINRFGEVAETVEEVIDEKKSIFYGLYTPVEMSRLFEKYNISLNTSILSNPDDASKYNTSVKQALNIGIYGVDLSYIKMFNQTQESIKYYMTLVRLSKDLGLPDDYVKVPAKSYNENLDDIEKLIEIATTTYVATEDYLKLNNREHIASLLLVGGWIEALYIATHGIYDDENPEKEIIERISHLKYSLSELMTLMGNHADNESVAEYLRKIKVLKKSFDQFEIYYEPGTVSVDTESSTINTEKSRIEMTAGVVDEIKQVVSEIRNEIIN
jgi:hypothetical protein